jgi:hypothetical protein
MKRISRWLAFLILLGSPLPSYAADHQDGTITGSAITLDPTADINDVFAWMSSNAAQVNLAISLFPNATVTSKFSDAVKYVFHTASLATYLGNEVSRDIICTFTNTTPQIASCWLVNPAAPTTPLKFATGDASAAAGIGDATFKVFAAPRADPFFFNLAGFKNAASVVAAAIKDAGASFNGTYIKGADTAAPGCPILTSTGRNIVKTYLNHDCTGFGSPIDFFKKPVDADNAVCTVKPLLVNTQQTKNAGLSGNIMAIVVQLDKSLLTTGGAVLNVWAATTK